jgi:hypothetical protein
MPINRTEAEDSHAKYLASLIGKVVRTFLVDLEDMQLNCLDTTSHSSFVVCAKSSTMEGQSVRQSANQSVSSAEFYCECSH